MSCGNGISVPFRWRARLSHWSRYAAPAYPARSGEPTSNVAEGREHARVQMVRQMAVEGPEPRIVCIEDDGHAASRRHKNGVAHGTGEALPVDLLTTWNLCPCS